MLNTQANTTKIKNVTTFESADNSVQLHINLAAHNLQVNGRKVQSITMYADTDCSGDLAVNWEEEDDSNYKHNTALLMRDNNDTNNNTTTMGMFYWDGEFTETLQQLLIENGFSVNSAKNTCTSEWGMQDVGRASYDAWDIAAEMLETYNLVCEEA